jgi:hypothetical protein
MLLPPAAIACHCWASRLLQHENGSGVGPMDVRLLAFRFLSLRKFVRLENRMRGFEGRKLQ